jgi:release factor glutamine methyltransferase
MSLRGGADGMTFLRRLLDEAPQLLSPGGALIMECAEDQAEPLRRMAGEAPWTRHSTIYHDLAGRPRGLFIEKVSDTLALKSV